MVEKELRIIKAIKKHRCLIFSDKLLRRLAVHLNFFSKVHILSAELLLRVCVCVCGGGGGGVGLA